MNIPGEELKEGRDDFDREAVKENREILDYFPPTGDCTLLPS